jgi:hypothetical protein
MTGRLQPGDRVRTPDGDGQIIASYIATHEINPAAYHIVQLDNDQQRKPYRTDQVELLNRQLTLGGNHERNDD